MKPQEVVQYALVLSDVTSGGSMVKSANFFRIV